MRLKKLLKSESDKEMLELASSENGVFKERFN